MKAFETDAKCDIWNRKVSVSDIISFPLYFLELSFLLRNISMTRNWKSSTVLVMAIILSHLFARVWQAKRTSLCHHDVKCKIELEENLVFYTAFYTGVDIFGEFEDHMNNNTYGLQVVDIMSQVIANMINTTVIVADISDQQHN